MARRPTSVCRSRSQHSSTLRTVMPWRSPVMTGHPLRLGRARGEGPASLVTDELRPESVSEHTRQGGAVSFVPWRVRSATRLSANGTNVINVVLDELGPTVAVGASRETATLEDRTGPLCDRWGKANTTQAWRKAPVVRLNRCCVKAAGAQTSRALGKEEPSHRGRTVEPTHAGTPSWRCRTRPSFAHCRNRAGHRGQRDPPSSSSASRPGSRKQPPYPRASCPRTWVRRPRTGVVPRDHHRTRGTRGPPSQPSQASGSTSRDGSARSSDHAGRRIKDRSSSRQAVKDPLEVVRSSGAKNAGPVRRLPP